VATEPAELFDIVSFVMLMEDIELGIFSDGSDEDWGGYEDENGGEDEDEDGDAIMVAAAGRQDGSGVVTHVNPMDLVDWAV